MKTINLFKQLLSSLRWGVVKVGLLLALMMGVVNIAKAAVAYAVYTPTNNTLTFYYDDQRYSHSGSTYSLNSSNVSPGWRENSEVTFYVVFDPSFDQARPQSTYNWFYEMSNLQDITGIEYLHTGNVTDMRWMFYGCSGLTSLDVSHFDTHNVTDMRYMFYGSSNLTVLDLSNFNTKKVENMESMFKNCTALTTIIAGDNWSTSAVSSSSSYAMFTGCINIKGRNGTTYDASHTDKEYARFDNAPVSPGYLSDNNHTTPITYNVSLRMNQVKAIHGDSTYVAEKPRLFSFTVEKGETFEIDFQRLNTDYDLLYFEENGQRTMINYHDTYTYSKTVNEDLYLECNGTPKNDKVTLQNSLGGSLKYTILRQMQSRLVELDSDSIDLASGYKIFSARKGDILWLSVTPRADYRIGLVRCNGVEQSVVRTATDGSQMYEYILNEDSVAVSVSYSKPKVNFSLYSNGTKPCIITQTFLNKLTGRMVTVNLISVTDGVASNSVNTPVLGEIRLKLLETPTSLYVNGVNRLADLSADNNLLLADATTENDLNVVVIYEEEETPGTLQTITRHGGGMSPMQFEYEIGCNTPCDNLVDGDCKQYLLPPYGADCESYFCLWIGLLDGETFKVYRNGENYTDYFKKGTYSSDNKYTHYSFEDSHWINENPEFWSSLREPATWEVFIEPATIDYTFIGDFKSVGVYADYNGDNDSYEGNALEAKNIEGLFSGKIIEKPENKGIEAGIYIRMPNPDDTFRGYRNGVEMTFEKMGSGSDTLWYLISDEDWMHEPAQWVIITDSELSRYDVDRDQQISIADVTKLVNKILGKE